MIVGIKDAVKLIGVSIVSFCAVFVCNLFLNYNMDMISIEDQIIGDYQTTFYETLKLTNKLVVIITGGCLILTSAVMLFFYIKQYITAHSKELGILKALGYSKGKTAKGFFVFGANVLIGTAGGYFSSFLLMPYFYEVQNEFLPQFDPGFHPILLVYLVILPSVLFAALSVAFAFIKLKKPVMQLLKGAPDEKRRKVKFSKNNKELPFLKELKKATLKSRKSLVFFIAFAAFCYSAMVQMSASMNELSSVMMGLIILLIGVVLACTSLFMAVSTVISSNKKAIAMLRVEGYSVRECQSSVLGCYRPIAYIGFVIGTGYQYGLLKVMVEVVFKDIENVPEYDFDFTAFIFCLISFAVLYEIMMKHCSNKIRKCSLKVVMEE